MKYLRNFVVCLLVLLIFNVAAGFRLIDAEDLSGGEMIEAEKSSEEELESTESESDNDLAQALKPDQADAIESIESNRFDRIEVQIQKNPEDPAQFIIKTVGASTEPSIESVLFPTWTERNNQDDLKWYEATRGSDGEYTIIVDTKDHGFETGPYQIHAYFYGSTLLKVDLKQYQPEVSDLKIEMTEIENDAYRIRITNANNPSGIATVVVPTWSDSGGQNDIRWEPANYLGQNTWEAVIALKHYSKSYDTYRSHVYLRDLNGNERFLGGVKKEILNPFRADPIDLDFHMYEDSGRFTINTDNCNQKAGIEKVYFAVWSDRNGQDDLKWYSGGMGKNGEYSASVDIENHGFETGKYTIHTYVYGRRNEQIAVNADHFKMEKGKIIFEFDQAVLNNTYKVRITNVSGDNGVKAVYLPTWSNEGGQDDIRWELASYLGNQTWEAKINLRDYRLIVDDFSSHGYLLNQKNEMEFLGRGSKKITQDTQTVYGFFAYPLDKNYRPNPSDPTDWFGPRWGDIHEGIDIPAPYYASCYAAGNGVVERAGYFLGYGRYVRIRSTDIYGESVSFFYGHLREINVCQGQTVSMGQLIGSVGGSGYNSQKSYIEDAYGPHLHFGAIANADDACVDPEIWIDFHNPYRNR